MTLRTPRRRISPRTKQRYRAIKNFLRKALGNSSQEDILTNATLEVSVSDLKNKIECIEQQLGRVSKHCQDIATLEEAFRKESKNSETKENLVVEAIQKPKKSKRNLKNVETEFLHQNLNVEYRKQNKSDNVINSRFRDFENGMSSCEPTFSKNLNDAQIRTKHRRCRPFHEIETFYKHHDKIKSKNDITPACSTSSFRCLLDPKHKEYVKPAFSSRRKKQSRRRECIYTPEEYREKEIVKREFLRNDDIYERQNNLRRNKRERGLDEDFIADIIEKQYKPVKLFGKRHSDFSQFSAPVCRDQEFRIREEIQEGSELCSCCFDDNRRQKHRYIRSNDLSDMRSICDTRLYSSKGHRCYKNNKKYFDDYNNTAFYDIVPVKEKSSPKSRRKFADDNKMIYHFKEVPPSPKTQRPRLNLKVQNYTEYENSLTDVSNQNQKEITHKNIKHSVDTYDSEVSARLQQIQKRHNEGLIEMNVQKSTQIQEEIEAMSNLQGPNLINDQINISNNDTTLNTQVTDSSNAKTDKTLGEIKNILQSFLLEIKKESTHDEKSNITTRIENKTMSDIQEDNEINTNRIANSRLNINHNVGQCGMPPFLPTFPSPCCYPIIPVCPMNCLQSGYMLPNPSFTCTACAKNSKENTCPEKECNNKNTSETKTNNETHELIKEIYKFVSQNPKPPRKLAGGSNNSNNNGNEMRNLNNNLLTNRSVGSTKAYKNDANVGTPNLRYCSKSCEAIGSRRPSEAYYTTNASYSDTILEKLSLEATQSSTESDVSTDVPTKKGKRSKLKKVLRSLRLLRRKKDTIEELSESESTVEVKVEPKPPFKQHITNYTMHGQEYFNPPPISQQHYHPHPHEYSYACDHRSAKKNFQHPIHNETYNYNRQYYDPGIQSHVNPTGYVPTPMCPNYNPHYNQLQPPQVPLCLKEIEVKSIGTQSVRKMSIFRKFTKKIQSPIKQDASQQYNSSPPAQNKPTLWQSFQEKAKQQTTDPMAYSLKTQKQLEQGDMKLRSAMLKKLFYKRNPFSPRNLIVRTLLGKDKSSFGNPPKMYRPRMFL